MKTVPTYTANIYCGLREAYDGPVLSPVPLESEVRNYVNAVGLGVTVTYTKFLYTDGEEPGVVLGLINYPRFPSEESDVRKHALALAKRVMKMAGQNRVTIVFSDRTIMLEREGL